jgi:lysophospholipase L1-like esterase
VARVAGLSAVALLAACARPPVISCLGDSITYGLVGGEGGGKRSRRDPEGGFPGRLQRRLGGAARVVNRGLGGSTTRMWLGMPGSEDRRLAQILLATMQWQDFTAADGERAPESLALATVERDRPDVVVLLIGINDLLIERFRVAPERVVPETLERLVGLRRQVATVAPVVLVSTLLPNARDPPDMIAAMNAAIRARWPDHLPLGENFAALDWPRLLGDPIHPNEAGQEVIASMLETQLRQRGLVEVDASGYSRGRAASARVADRRGREHRGSLRQPARARSRSRGRNGRARPALASRARDRARAGARRDRSRA